MKYAILFFSPFFIFEKWRTSSLYFSPPLQRGHPVCTQRRATLALVPPHDERIHIHGVISGPWNMLLVNVSAALSSHRWSRYPSFYYYKLYSSISFHISRSGWVCRKLDKTCILLSIWESMDRSFLLIPDYSNSIQVAKKVVRSTKRRLFHRSSRFISRI